MPTNATRLSDRQLKAVKATGKDFVLSDGDSDGLQLRVRASSSMMWNFNYHEPLTRSRINMAHGPYPNLSLTKAYAEDIWRSLTLHVFPGMKTTPLSQITAPMVIKILRPIEAKGSLETVKRLSQRLNES